MINRLRDYVTAFSDFTRHLLLPDAYYEGYICSAYGEWILYVYGVLHVRFPFGNWLPNSLIFTVLKLMWCDVCHIRVFTIFDK